MCSNICKMNALVNGIYRVRVNCHYITNQSWRSSCQKPLILFFNYLSSRNIKNHSAASSIAAQFKPDTTMTAKKESFYRLPKNISPYHYDISLVPDLTNFKFDGRENIHLDIKATTDTVMLNASELNIAKVLFSTTDGKEIAAKNVELCEKTKIVTIKFPENLPTGKSGHLHLEFQGTLNDQMAGFYRSKYTSPDGVTKYAAVTQFEAVDARKCFPCWDEPAVKATFDMTLTVPAGLTALSNMPIKTKQVNGALETLTYERSPKMSTYLVAIVIGEFDYVEDKSIDGTLIRVYTPMGKKEQGRFALEVASKVLPYYNKYFGIPYPLPKMDLVAIPDFSSGAMENWGLITYRESCLLMDPEHTSTINKQFIVIFISHEIAHQWFGNLVTMEWWTHLWLNEGYASFMEFLCAGHLFPEYNIWTQFVTSMFSRAQELDSLKSTHPVEVPVDNPDEIDEIFDDISYNKGASIIRMLHSYIGGEDFQKGMQLYLTKHSYGNTETSDLWAALEEASKKPVKKIMSGWTEQAGYPLLKVEQRQEGKDRILSFSQQRFLADGSVDESNNMWLIPVGISSSVDAKCIISNTVLDQTKKELTIPNIPEKSWVKVNSGTIGFYRMHYSPEMLALFVPSIKDLTLPPLDRFNLLDDAFSVAKSGQASTIEVLKLLQAYRYEDTYTVWTNISNCMSTLDILLGHLEIHTTFQHFCRDLLKDVTQRVGWEPKPGESHLDTLLRSLVLNRMVMLGDENTIAEAKKRFQQHISKESVLSADLRSAVYRAVVINGDEATMEQMMELYRKTDLHEEKDRILAALGAAKDCTLLRKALFFALSDDVRAQDMIFVFPMACRTHKGRVTVWNFAKEEWATLSERYNSGGLRGKLIQYITENIVTEDMLQDVESFFKKHSKVGTERTVQQSIEKIRLNISWLKRDKTSIEEFVHAQK